MIYSWSEDFMDDRFGDLEKIQEILNLLAGSFNKEQTENSTQQPAEDFTFSEMNELCLEIEQLKKGMGSLENQEQQSFQQLQKDVLLKKCRLLLQLNEFISRHQSQFTQNKKVLSDIQDLLNQTLNIDRLTHLDNHFREKGM